MKSFGFLLALLVFYIDTAVAKHPKDVVKHVGKRWLSSTGFGQKIEWYFTKTSSQKSYRAASVINTAQDFRVMTSDEHFNWLLAETIFATQLGSDFKATICGMPGELNMLEYMHFWMRRRTTLKHTPGDLLYEVIDDDPTAHNVTFLIKFPVTSKFTNDYDLVVKMYGEFRGAYELLDAGYIFTIVELEELGSCKDYGNVNWKVANYTDVFTVPEDDPEERDKVQTYIEQLFKVGEPLDVLPLEWFVKATAHDEFFTSEVCHDSGQTVEMMNMTKKELATWWEKFQMMWHTVPNATDHTKVQPIGVKKGDLMFRINMKLQIGIKPEAEVTEFGFKLQIKYNVHGDERWYIDKFEVGCPPFTTKKMMEFHAGAIRESIGVRLGLMVKSDEQWYHVAHLLDPFINGTRIDIKVCEGIDKGWFWDTHRMNDAKNWTDMDYTFWKNNKESPGYKLLGYELEGGEPSADETTSYTMKVHWGPLRPGVIQSSQWKFELEWDEFYQFYHIISVAFYCPTNTFGDSDFKPLSRGELCRYKLCNYKQMYPPPQKI